ncbi:hypothetical protein GNI_082760 [Gregarina niphandrodes]|uniref:Uncharacterized protein n=1 Tax=Gregarina niphandrodes TaxID=110365 RepID=A0A023B672_GRENI|nr:hypothetical protein GNI_082760 [Gregarina niphandrodes]EZG65628.1 hypothetical protein GNI_082760 [Gregarina niphandrodes]|eukprot:XP_011134070.1 hypothetical protein GNI_082760 [Gregarina niphandrodes]
MQGSTRLRQQLASIRQSINRFEEELAHGNDRKQTEIDNKFEAVKTRMEGINAAIDVEAKKATVECSDFVRKTTQYTQACADHLLRWMGDTMSKYTRPLTQVASKLDSIETILHKVEVDGSKLELRDAVKSLKNELELLKSSINQFAVDQDSLENELLRRMFKLDQLVDQQVRESPRSSSKVNVVPLFGTFTMASPIAYWQMIMSEAIAALKARYDMLSADGPSDESSFSSTAVEAALSRGQTTNDATFRMYVDQTLLNLRESIATLSRERQEADGEIVRAADKYTGTLQRSLEAATSVKTLATELARDT